MRFFRALIPAPLLRLDHHLLLHYPRLWATRIHYHLWFLLLCNAAVLLLALLLPVSTHGFPDPEFLFGWMMLPALIYFAFWVYKVVLFSADKALAPPKHWTISLEFLLLWTSIALIMSLPYTLGLTVNCRIAHTVTDDELIADVDSLNRHAWLFLDEDARYFSPTKEWERNTLNSHAYFRNEAEYADPSINAEDGTSGLQQVLSGLIAKYVQLSDHGPAPNPTEAARLRAAIDSIETHYPLYFIQFGRFTPHGSWHLNYVPYLDTPNMGAAYTFLKERYIADMRRSPLVDLKSVQHVLDLARKYDPVHRIPSSSEVQDAFLNGKRSGMHWYTTQARINKIDKAKGAGQFFQEQEIMVHVVLIGTFVLTLLLCMFRSIYWQPFLLLFVTAALLPVVVAFFLLLSDTGSDRVFVCTWWAIGIGVLITAFVQRRTPVYAPYFAVLQMLADLAIAFMLFFTLQLLHQYHDIFGLDALRSDLYNAPEGTSTYTDLQHAVAEHSARVDMILVVALWGGMLGYALLLHPWFRSGYQRLFALPERK